MWKYYEVLNTGLTVLLVVAAGYSSVGLGFMKQEHVAILNKFVFKITLPALVCRGIGLKVDLYDPEIWRFVGAFLILRFVMMIGCAVAAAFQKRHRPRAGTFVVHWLATTWISTVILGVPVLTASLGPQFGWLGLMAGVSSFIFQLPVMLLTFEFYSWRQTQLGMTTMPNNAGRDLESANGGALESTSTQPLSKPHEVLAKEEGPVACPVSQPGRVWSHRGAVKSLVGRILHNHVLWGIGLGFVLSLSTIGGKYLDPGNPPKRPNAAFVEETGFIDGFLEWVGRCTTPVALFATGMWMHGKNAIACGYTKAATYLFVKFIVVPLLMMATCYMVDLEGEMARGAVLISVIPISLASFSLSKEYGVGEDVMTTNVCVGTILMLPFVVAFLEFMDAVDMFVSPTS